jgi:hypothetical protein
MVNFIKIRKAITISCSVFFLFVVSSCATSMTPIEINNTLPTLTVSKFITQAQANESTNTKKCKYLVKGRNYNAPIGMSTKDDLRNGAKGIDEWVKLDGGNAYVLTNYKWVSVNNGSATQLYIEFDTLLCE